MSLRITLIILPCVGLLGCPEPGEAATETLSSPTATSASSSDSSSGVTTQAEPTASEPTTDTSPTGPTTPDSTSTDSSSTDSSSTDSSSTDSSSTDSSTTGTADDPGAARVFFMTTDDSFKAVTVKTFDILDGVVSAPVELLAAPDGHTFTGTFYPSPNRRWLAVESASVSPDRTWLIDTETLTVKEIDAAPADSVNGPKFSPDSTVLGLIGSTGGVASELYACTLTAEGDCTPTKMNPPLAPNQKVGSDFALLGPWLLYQIHGPAGSRAMLGNLAAPGEATELKAYPIDYYRSLGRAALAADQKALYFSIDIDVHTEHQFFAVDLGVDPPGKAVLVHPPALTSSWGRLSPDASTLLWWSGDGTYGDLYKVPLVGAKGGTPVRLNTTPGQAVDQNFAWSPDGVHAVFLAGPGLKANDLYAIDVLVDPPAPVKLSSTPVSAPIQSDEFSPDGEHFAFTGIDAMGETIYRATIDAPTDTVALSGKMTASSFRGWSADSERVMYVGDQDTPGTYELFMVDVSGVAPTPPVKLNAPLGTSKIGVLGFSADARRAFFVVEPKMQKPALYTVEFDAEGQPSPPVEVAADILSSTGEYQLLVLPPPT